MGVPCGAMVKVLDYGLEGSSFELQLYYYIHLLEKVWTLISPAMG